MAFSAKAVANYFLDLAKSQDDHSVSPMKMQKLVYFAHGWSLGLAGNPMIEEKVQAWPYGPVIPELYHEFKHFGNGEIVHYATDLNWGKDGVNIMDFEQVTPEIPNDELDGTQQARALLNRVWEVYKPFTPVQLSNATHQPQTPWDTINKQFGGKIPKNTEIPNDLIREHFAKLAGK